VHRSFFAGAPQADDHVVQADHFGLEHFASREASSWRTRTRARSAAIRIWSTSLLPHLGLFKLFAHELGVAHITASRLLKSCAMRSELPRLSKRSEWLSRRSSTSRELASETRSEMFRPTVVDPIIVRSRHASGRS